jgi:hypothetical protein
MLIPRYDFPTLALSVPRFVMTTLSTTSPLSSHLVSQAKPLLGLTLTQSNDFRCARDPTCYLELSRKGHLPAIRPYPKLLH